MSETPTGPHPDDLVRFRDAEPGVHVPPTSGAGDIVVRADLVGTALFTVTAALAAALFTTVWQWIAAITVLVLFTAGIFAFLWAYYNAVQRSRTEEITVSQLYFLFGPAIPSRVRTTMLGALAVQTIVALVTAFARLDGPDGNPGSSLALGFLMPMFGFGMNGLWAAYHGAFPPRATKPRAEPVAKARQASESSSELGGERSEPEQRAVAPVADPDAGADVSRDEAAPAEPVARARQASESSSELGGERSEPEHHSEPEHDQPDVVE